MEQNENKFNFPVNSFIVIELCRTNAVKKSKEKYFRNQNITAIEIEIFDKIKFEGNIEILQKQLLGYFGKKRFAKRLHDPNCRDLNKIKEKEKVKLTNVFEEPKKILRQYEQVVIKNEISENIIPKPINNKSLFQRIIDLLFFKKQNFRIMK